MSALLNDIEEVKKSQMSSIDLTIEVAGISAKEIEEHEAKCRLLEDHVEELEAKCEELVAKALAGDKATEELLKQQAAYKELEDTCSELRIQLQSFEKFDTGCQELPSVGEELTVLKDQHAKLSKEKCDLDLLCGNLMEELDEKHNTAAVSTLLYGREIIPFYTSKSVYTVPCNYDVHCLIFHSTCNSCT